MTSLCCRPVSSRVISQFHVDRLLTSKPKEPSHRSVRSSQWPRTILVSTNQGGRGHGAAGLPCRVCGSTFLVSSRANDTNVTGNVAAFRLAKITILDALEYLGLRSQNRVLRFRNVAVDDCC